MWPLVLVKARNGNIDYHYLGDNPLIEWLSPEQEKDFLERGAVERIDTPDAEPEPDPDTINAAIQSCIDVMDLLGLPADCGNPTARLALRNARHAFSNDTVADAVRTRKNQPTKGN